MKYRDEHFYLMSTLNKLSLNSFDLFHEKKDGEPVDFDDHNKMHQVNINGTDYSFVLGAGGFHEQFSNKLALLSIFNKKVDNRMTNEELLDSLVVMTPFWNQNYYEHCLETKDEKTVEYLNLVKRAYISDCPYTFGSSTSFKFLDYNKKTMEDLCSIFPENIGNDIFKTFQNELKITLFKSTELLNNFKYLFKQYINSKSIESYFDEFDGLYPAIYFNNADEGYFYWSRGDYIYAVKEKDNALFFYDIFLDDIIEYDEDGELKGDFDSFMSYEMYSKQKECINLINLQSPVVILKDDDFIVKRSCSNVVNDLFTRFIFEVKGISNKKPIEDICFNEDDLKSINYGIDDFDEMLVNIFFYKHYAMKWKDGGICFSERAFSFKKQEDFFYENERYKEIYMQLDDDKFILINSIPKNVSKELIPLIERALIKVNNTKFDVSLINQDVLKKINNRVKKLVENNVK